MTTVLSPKIRVGDIPGLDAAPAYGVEASASANALPQVFLPSGHRAVHLTRYADVSAVLGDPSLSRAATNVEGGPSFFPTTLPPEMLINLDVPDHARMRATVTKAYSANRVAELRGLTEEILAERLDVLQADPAPDLFRTVLDEIPSRLNSQFLGIPLADREIYRSKGHAVQCASPDDLEKLLSDFYGLYAYLLEVAKGTRPCDPEGFVGRLLVTRQEASPPLTDEEIVGLLIGSVVAGDQNTVSVLTKAVYTLLVARPLWDQLVAEPEILPGLVEELVRLIPMGTIASFPRITTRETTISHGTLPIGTVVYPDSFAANRDPEYFVDPLVIDPRRTGPRHLQFGYGMHHCMGAALARMQLAAVIGGLAKRFPRLRLAVDPAELSWDSGVALRRPNTLPVTW